MSRMSFFGRFKTARGLARRLVEDAVEQQFRFGDEEYEVEVDLPDDPAQLWTLIGSTDRYVEAAIAARAVLRNRLAEAIGEGGSVRFGGTLIRYSSSIDRTPTPGLARWLAGLGADEVLAILPTRNFRVSALRKIAEAHDLDPDVLEGTLYVEDRKPPTVSSMPVDHDRAPKYAAEMKDGEIREGRKRKA